MHGFICIISSGKKPVSIDVKWKQPFDFQGEMAKRRIDGSEYFVEQFTSQKFIEERHWINNQNFLFVTEGAIVNFDILMKEYNAANSEDLIAKLFQKEIDFFKKFEGNFAGVFYNKLGGIWYGFNNQTNTKKLYFFQNADYLIFGTDLFTFSQALKELKIPYSLDEQASYQLIASRMLFEDFTLIREVKRLRAGEFLEFANGKIRTEFYFHLADIQKNNHNKKAIIENLNDKFLKSIQLNHELDLKYGYNHLTTLSGGFDSRTEFISAFESGYKQHTLVNFSHDGYADQIISKQIADYFQVPILHFTIESDSLKSIDEVIAVNDGQVSYDGCFHLFDTLKKLKLDNFGSIHTGIMADTMMGSYITRDKESVKNRLSPKNIDIPMHREYVDNLIDTYESAEMCVIYNTIFQGESNGFTYFDLTGNTLSPFLNTDFLSYAFSIPENWKEKSYIYIEWMKKMHPSALKFTWESIGCKPTNNQLIRQFAMYRRALLKRLPVKTIWKYKLAPTQLWYDTDQNFKAEIDRYFYENIERISNAKLKKDLLKFYAEGNFLVKANCITVVGAVKLLFD